MMSNQEAIAQAQAYACINHCIPFSEYIPAFKRRMAAVMETRNIQSDRELCPGTNLAEHLIITRKGAFEILADIELRMSETAAQLVYDESGNAVVAEGQKRLKTFTRVPIMKLDKPGTAWRSRVIYFLSTAPLVQLRVLTLLVSSIALYRELNH